MKVLMVVSSLGSSIPALKPKSKCLQALRTWKNSLVSPHFLAIARIEETHCAYF